ncbi:hypothetical protein L1987_43130 [Smallanthus sonchifolius]|uniref:Uncharacterized protein n=1 Tax=Smallanthus sonchifolius TaxID=185202 RepID=A0ACB9GLU1_9ASTR|nr:hypothetical protein L1987_43130 [Smallanthus sonchifolius]
MDEQEQFDRALRTTCDRIVTTEEGQAAMEQRITAAGKSAEAAEQRVTEAEHRATTTTMTLVTVCVMLALAAIRILETELRDVQEDMGILNELRNTAFVLMDEQEQFDRALRTTCDRIVTTEEGQAAMEQRITAAGQSAEAAEQRVTEAEHRATTTTMTLVTVCVMLALAAVRA